MLLFDHLKFELIKLALSFTYSHHILVPFQFIITNQYYLNMLEKPALIGYASDDFYLDFQLYNALLSFYYQLVNCFVLIIFNDAT